MCLTYSTGNILGVLDSAILSVLQGHTVLEFMTPEVYKNLPVISQLVTL